MLLRQLPVRWELESVFEGGSGSEGLRAHLASLDKMLTGLNALVNGAQTPDTDAGRDHWVEMVEAYQAAERRLWQASAFVGCLTAQDVSDRPAKSLESRMHAYGASLQEVGNLLDAKMLEVSAEVWAALMAEPRLVDVAFVLDERRRHAVDKMPASKENLATQLAVDGYHAWGGMYDRLVARVTSPLEVDGQTLDLSVGQAYNKFAHPDKDFRQNLFQRWEKGWNDQSELFATTLNHLAGFRLRLYEQRKWNSVLKEPLANNRMTEATLGAMWEAVSAAKGKLVEYHHRKARHLGVQTLDWYDQMAPLHQAGRKIPYQEAATFIIDHFARFSPRMSNFAHRAFENAWIEVEDRPGKRPGGFYTSFPESAQGRIFMTYGGDTEGVNTLAHELGHAYHSNVMFDLPPLVQNYAMNVAETASTFAELITSNAAIRNAVSKQERLALLDDKIKASVGYLMNIRARYIFETRFYDQRKHGTVEAAQLNEMMETAQKEAFGDSFGVHHPLFWAAKLHFYATDAPFYNFPYTFGYLFSAGIYARAMEEGASFDSKYVDLLRDTGRTTVEDLARRHLGVDLTRADFWMTGVQVVLDDVDEFLRLTETND